MWRRAKWAVGAGSTHSFLASGYLEFSFLKADKPFKSFGFRNPDGWGIGWYHKNESLILKEGVSILESTQGYMGRSCAVGVGGGCIAGRREPGRAPEGRVP